MNNGKVKPVRRIRFLASDSSEILLEVECVDGRIKWDLSIGIVSLKLQISHKATGRDRLHNFESKVVAYDLEVIGEDVNATPKLIRFSGFRINKFEFRSLSMDTDFKFGICRYFIEGSVRAKNAAVI